MADEENTACRRQAESRFMSTVNAPDPLISMIFEKLEEQVERLDHLIAMIPVDRLDWRPKIDDAAGEAEVWTISELLGHLLDCLAGFCAAIFAVYGDKLPDWEDLRALPVNHACGKEEAASRVRIYMRHIRHGFGLLEHEDLKRKVSTVFVPSGEPLLVLLLGNLEHLINHKFQLFFCLKILGIPVESRDLYRFRTTIPDRASKDPSRCFRCARDLGPQMEWKKMDTQAGPICYVCFNQAAQPS